MTEPRTTRLSDNTIALRLAPPTQQSPLPDYALDAVTLYFGDDGVLLDLRFNLGSGYDIYAAVPVEPQGRLRLFHVDSAVIHVDDITIELDPCALDLPPLEWTGTLAVIAGRVVEFVRLTSSSSPAAYRCEAAVRDPDGRLTTYVLQYPTRSAAEEPA
ncbi:MAG: hypothetical protein Q8O67_09635 [Deltaproteobacteria bacterium]|nr:hypothetical protein [Deltaproteobacteria bacterium]